MPANPTLKEITARVEALERENSRLAAIGNGSAGAVFIEPAIPETPMVERYQVRSELTGAVVVTCDARSTAGDEADRLNEECRVHRIKHRGEDMRYEVVTVLEPDAAAGYEITVSEMKRRIDEADGDERKALVVELEGIESRNEATNGE